jgi:ABC-type Zn uptake system ZnuABC Zn-binding protein ZnuA
MRTPVLLLSALALVVAAASGCGGATANGGGKLTVVATTTQVADLVRSVGGRRVDVHGILSANSDPHDYEPRPSDAASLTEAKVVFKSGGDLDEWLDELIDNAGSEAKEVSLIDSVRTLRGDHEVDPHWWEDPRNPGLAVAAIRDALAEADPAGRAAYARRAARYEHQLRDLDADIARCVDRVPAARRKLVTTHDALGYFARRYGLEVIGAVIPSLSTQAQPSAKDVDLLVRQIEEEGVEAIFPEAALSQKLEQAISREAGAQVGGKLWADTLGPRGSGADTYLGAMRANADTLAEGMSGGRVRCSFRR